MSQITTDVITKTAALARIKLTPDEIVAYAAQLGTVMEHVDRISQVDTSDVLPTFQVTNSSSRFQSESAAPQTLTLKSVTSSAPKSHLNYIVTQPSIIK